MLTVASVKPSVNSILKYQQLLEQDRFIYVETEDPDFDWIEFAKLVTGKDLMLQYGEPIFHVKFEPKFMNFSDARGSRCLLPHTEASDYPNPPEYLMLWCQKPADCGGGMTTLAYVEGFLKTLTEAEKQKLMETRHYFGATAGVHANRGEGAVHPILTYSGDKPILRFSCNYIKYGDYSPDPENLQPFTPDPFLADISDRLLDYYEQNCLRIRMKQHSCLLWDNQCMAHTRTPYTDLTRSLERIFLG